MMRTAKLVLPIDPEGLVREEVAHLSAPSDIENRLEEYLYLCGEGSREKRLRRGVIYGKILADEEKKLIARDVICYERLNSC